MPSSTSSAGRVDLDLILESVQGLIKVNHEIWERCKDHMIPSEEKNEIKLYKIAYEKVKVRTKRSTNRTNSSNGIDITTRTELSVKSFGRIPSLPTALSDMFPLSEKTLNDKSIPDYDWYLQSLVLLEDGILEAFLSILQTHLEELQAYLGDMECWLLDETVAFLKEVFGMELILGTIDADNCRSTECTSGEYCIQCWRKVNAEKTQNHGCIKSSGCCVYHGEKIVLKSFGSKESMDITFDVTTKRDKDRLKAYLQFLEL